MLISSRAALVACSIAVLSAVPTVTNATTLTAAQSSGVFNLTLSDAFGTGTFGTVTVTNLGGGTADIKLDMSPTSSSIHAPTSLSRSAWLLAEVFSRVRSAQSELLPLVSGSGPFSNSPFGGFNVAIQSSCTQGNCGPSDGSTIDLHVLISLACSAPRANTIRMISSSPRISLNPAAQVTDAPASSAQLDFVTNSASGRSVAFRQRACWRCR